MKTLCTVAALCLLLSCQKKEAAPPPPITIADTALRIPGLKTDDINAVSLTCRVTPGTEDTYSNVQLYWSTTSGFDQDSDSSLLADNLRGPLEKTVPLKDLKAATTYYARVGSTFKGTRFFSTVKSWTTDSLRITHVSYNDAPSVCRGQISILFTNLAYALNGVIEAQVYLGPYPCPVVTDQAKIIVINVPQSIPLGHYRLELRRKGLTAQFGQPVEVLRGQWEELTPPPFPLHPTAVATGLYIFGTAQSSTKGWIVGGTISNEAPSEQEGYLNGSLYEFDPQQQQWTRRLPVNRRYFDRPLCHYYNNSIYVIGGIETVTSANSTYYNHRQTLKKMKRLDLGSLTWYDMDSVPYRNFTNMASFAYNNEFYIGMGANGDSLSQCCSKPLPSKKFWKYNPATNAWTRLADFPGGHQDNPTLFTIGTKAYAWYGAIPAGDPNISTTFTQELWEYDIPANSWRPLPLAAGSLLPGEKCSVITYNGKAYFLTAQKKTLFGGGYGYSPQSIFMEWEPVTNTFRKIAYPTATHILQPVYHSDNRYYFQSDAMGYVDNLPNNTYLLTLE